MAQPAVVGGGRPSREGRVARRVLLGAAVISCLAQLIALYRPAGPPAPDLVPHLDKVGHLVIFAVPVLLIMLWRAARRRGRPGPWFGTAVIAIFVGHAVLSEVVQGALLPDRSGDLFDVGADLLGIAIGYGTAVLIIARRTLISQWKPGDR
ncbi:VanZ family protein [Microlunatus parietis]|uniref:VanZ family protein n=1 Tax=Microlunatus parietis TaxID=682979 RepID=A0A7Y9I435_9ACTN|nr:VanZ family protein [Microlunatus parietis]NYE69864.1 VanZ family protein [Microlunatus parietis]